MKRIIISLCFLGAVLAWPSYAADHSHFREIVVTNVMSTELTDHQAMYELSYTEHMQADFSDVRFYAEDRETELSHYLMEKVDSDIAVYYIKVPSLPAESSVVIYVYYGDDSLSSASSKVDTLTNDYSGDEGLLLQYQFDEGTGTSVTDTSSQSHTGTFAYNGTGGWYGSDCFFDTGDAVMFDGAGLDRVDIDSFAIATELNDDFTLETWFMVDEATDSWGWFFGESTGDEFLVGKQHADTSLHYNIKGFGGYEDGISTYTVGEWHHLVVTHDMSESNSFRFYIDGVAVAIENEQNLSPTTVGNLRLGSRGDSWLQTLDGALDEVRVYNRYFEEPEATAHYYHVKYAAMDPSLAEGEETSVAAYYTPATVKNLKVKKKLRKRKSATASWKKHKYTTVLKLQKWNKKKKRYAKYKTYRVKKNKKKKLMKKLKPDTKYRVRARKRRTVDGEYYYSDWSKWVKFTTAQ